MSETEQSIMANQYIGVAAVGVPDGCTFFTGIVLRGALKALLRRDGVEWLGWSGSRQPTFVVELITARERGPVLAAVHAALDEIGILGVCQIAYLDWDEIYWRTVHGPPGAEPFIQFLNPLAAAEAARESKAWLDVFKELLSRQEPPEGSRQT